MVSIGQTIPEESRKNEVCFGGCQTDSEFEIWDAENSMVMS